MGDFDLFVSKRENVSQDWGAPENMGYPINTHHDESGLIVSKVFFGVVIFPFMKCPNLLLFFDSHLKANSEDSKEGP